jgi:hypothetical protein
MARGRTQTPANCCGGSGARACSFRGRSPAQRKLPPKRRRRRPKRRGRGRGRGGKVMRMTS